MKERIFISYKCDDKDIVFKIKDDIEKNVGEKCWIDLDGIESDAQFVDVIIKAINEAEIFLFMYSKKHGEIENYKKDWTTRELSYAEKRDKKIIFINLDGSNLTDYFEFKFGEYQQVDAASTTAMSRLYSDLSKWLETKNSNIVEKDEKNVIEGKSVLLQKEEKKNVTLENGHEYVDLGLPSGLKWATCNVGATKPEECGDYFAWGEVKQKTEYDWSTYKYVEKDGKLTKYCSDSSYGKDGFTDSKIVLDPEDDAATVNWGGNWRMPTYKEMGELREKCTWIWTTQNGVKGYKVVGPNGNSIFLPAAGYMYNSSLYNAGSHGNYWSSSLNTSNPYDAYGVNFGSSYVGRNNYRRLNGRSVRPVCQ